MIRSKFQSEIEALFPVGFARRELGAHWKISTPGAASPGHRDPHLLRFTLVEEPTAQSLQFAAHGLVNAVTDDVEESTFPARCPDLLRHMFGCAIHQRSNVDHGNRGKLAETHPTTMLTSLASCLKAILLRLLRRKLPYSEE